MSENHLKYETSPYLLEHQDNPVHWWAWGPEALAEAKRTGKPILLSVGYAACHWCHVMAHESFEDPGTAQVMNDLFINIKVDREERPDIDAIYMGALHRLGEQGGWPLTMFLDSEAKPFWGGTYFPRESRYGRPAFVTVLLRIAEAYQNQPENVRKNTDALIASLKEEATTNEPAEKGPDVRDLVQRIARAVDREHGGLNGAPKFPQWNIFWLLWRGAIRFGDETAKQGVITTLRNICQGGIYDHLGGGFARYSVDEYWLVPHFEKMLYDNALLIDLMTEVWRETQERLFKIRIAETVAWLKREMIGEAGGFAASLDADSEGEEGKFYVWSAEEIADVLGVEDAAFFSRIYGVTPQGNFEGHTILNRLETQALLSADEEARLATMREKLLAKRASRIRPGWDDKILADWNGLAIAALSRAAIVFEEPEWLSLAEQSFGAIIGKLSTREHGRLFHNYRKGVAKTPAVASDYANMIWAALRLYEATLSEGYLSQARQWADVLDLHYWDRENGGYFTAADDTSDVVVRLKSASDDAVPSANAIQLSNLIALAALTGDTRYDERASELVKAFSGAVARTPTSHCGLIAAEFDLDRLLQVAVIGDGTSDLQNALRNASLPGAVVFVSKAGSFPEGSALAGKGGRDGKSTAYVCVGSVCGAPIQETQELAKELLIARS